jgi:hypothetical protein
VEKPPIFDHSHHLQSDSKRCQASEDFSQKPVLSSWPEPCTLIDEKDHDLDGYLFDDSCLFVA